MGRWRSAGGSRQWRTPALCKHDHCNSYTSDSPIRAWERRKTSGRREGRGVLPREPPPLQGRKRRAAPLRGKSIACAGWRSHAAGLPLALLPLPALRERRRRPLHFKARVRSSRIGMPPRPAPLPPLRRQRLDVERRRLPAWSARDKLVELVKDNQVLVVIGETGSGKTTQVGAARVHKGEPGAATAAFAHGPREQRRAEQFLSTCPTLLHPAALTPPPPADPSLPVRCGSGPGRRHCLHAAAPGGGGDRGAARGRRNGDRAWGQGEDSCCCSVWSAPGPRSLCLCRAAARPAGVLLPMLCVV